MKVLVATRQTQGARPNDYCFTVEGELVRTGEVCRRDRDDPDGPCGCGRGFGGLASHRATTTARVAELSLTPEEYTEAYRSSMDDQGWYRCPDCLAADVGFLTTITAECAVGTILERRLEAVQVRCSDEEVPA